MADPVRYRVSMPRPHAHLFEVEARFPATPGDLRVHLPVWTPGSYLVREFARHLQDVAAFDDAGANLPLRRVDKRTFEVSSGGAPVLLRYRVYANDLTVRTNHLDDSHGYFNGAGMFLYAEPLRATEHRLEVVAPEGWRSFCALDPKDGEWIAQGYDDLIDAPVEIGPHEPVCFEVRGVPHQVVLWGDAGLDRARLAGELRRTCEAVADLFGELPLRRYLFIVHLTDKGRGGLEHHSSSTLLLPRFGVGTARGWEDLLNLAAHEYFHLWNIKRIRPAAFTPYDYGQEQYTTLLWAFEGLTAYYDMLLVRRAGLTSAARYLTRIGEALTALHGTPGRRALSLADASLWTWIKQYRPDENATNSFVSYYLKGELVSLLLDLELRRATDNRRSLDDVVRLLWQRHGRGVGVPEDGVERAASEVAGVDLTAFFDRAIRGTQELDYGVFEHAGLQLRFRPRESAGDKGGTPPGRGRDVRARGWLGLTTRGSQTISAVLEGSPAQEAGLYPDDELVALDGYRVDSGALLSRCEERPPGEPVRVTVFRRDRLREIPVVLGTKPADAAYLVRMEGPTEAQRAAYASWLGVGWDDPG
jgi:predicted metalloprotease with PDZ domain